MELVKRKWGHYLTFFTGNQFKFKILRFKSGGEISYQRHLKRGELWIFLKGGGFLTIAKKRDDKEKIYIEAGSSYHIGRKIWHHFKADSKTLILEIQYGECLEEDIERK